MGFRSLQCPPIATLHWQPFEAFKQTGHLKSIQDPHSAFSALWRGSYIHWKSSDVGMTHCKRFPLRQHLLDLMRIQGLSLAHNGSRLHRPFSEEWLIAGRLGQWELDWTGNLFCFFSLSFFSTAFHNYRGEAASGKGLAVQVVSSDQFNHCSEATLLPS